MTHAAVALRLGRSRKGATVVLQGLRGAFGPGALVAVGYIDPGNWATDLGAGSAYGYGLLSIVLISSLMAMVLQSLAARLGIATGLNLAEACRARSPRSLAVFLWVMAQIAIIACDMAEVVGSAFALKLLFGIPMLIGVFIGAGATLLLLMLERNGRRGLEAAVIMMSLLVASCLFVDVVMAAPSLGDVAWGLLPTADLLSDRSRLLLAVGIVGATVMPHNLYLHSALVVRPATATGPGIGDKGHRLRWAVGDACVALMLAFFVNAAILVLAGAAFGASGHRQVADFSDAYRLLTPLLGTSLASVLFGVALLAAGQSSTVTATMAGGIIAEGFLRLRVDPWRLRLATRCGALVPAVLAILLAGEGSLTWLLVLSQVVLSLQLPFAVVPLILFCRDRGLMGELVAPRALTAVAGTIALALICLNIGLILAA
jgi:manganese transport protein